MFGKVLVRGSLAAGIVAYAVAAHAVVTIDTVRVTNPGNANDSTGYGGVGYAYAMGKYEVTNLQYCEFLNNKLPAINAAETGTVLVGDTYGLYNRGMETNARGGIAYDPSAGLGVKFSVKSGYANMPVTYVSWYDGIRFANWLENGQGSGGTESGTYAITGGGPNSGNVTVPDAATRATWGADLHWALPSENEWYKSAYYQPAAQSGDTDNYWAYPTATNDVPHSDNPASLAFPTNSANFNRTDSVANGYDDGYAVTGSTSYVSTQNYLTNVGAYTQSDSFYGTFDQGGNVWEWNEALIAGSSRGLRGGYWSGSSDDLAASSRGSIYPTYEYYSLGFRVANVTEPGLPGDANRSGTTDATDLNTVLSFYNQNGTTWETGDFNRDGHTDATDLNTVLSFYNQTSGGLQMGSSNLSTVPEPSSIVMLASLAALFGAWVIRRR